MELSAAASAREQSAWPLARAPNASTEKGNGQPRARGRGIKGTPVGGKAEWNGAGKRVLPRGTGCVVKAGSVAAAAVLAAAAVVVKLTAAGRASCNAAGGAAAAAWPAAWPAAVGAGTASLNR